MAKYDKADIERRMNGAVESLKSDLSGLRTGRANTSLLDPVVVEVYGAMMPLNQVATVSAPEPRMLSVQVWDKANVTAVEKGIAKSNLGLNPMIDGQNVRLPMPDLTEERRKELAKLAGQYAEQAKIAIRNVRRDGMEALKDDEKKKEISEDDRKRCLAAGMNDYITKPLSLLALSNVLALQLTPAQTPSTPIAAESGNDVLLNEATLATLTSSIGADSVKQLVMLYHQQVHDYIGQLVDCFASNTEIASEQLPQMERLAHQLRGESLSIGAEQLAAQSKHLEQLAGQPEASSAQIEEAFSALHHCAARTHAALEQWHREHQLN